ncbi:MAG: exodeoxyribonuclease VII large subunit [Candidatus Paceibacterota bacterium]|jgi:exodeoxyribonuclease VII large subunit
MNKKKNEQTLFEEKPLTVSEYIELLNTALAREEVRLVGEAAEIKSYPSGHVYFSLKDEKANAVMNCVIWKGNYARCGVVIEAGMRVVLTGIPSVYAPTGRFSFVASMVELQGEGALKKAYDELKKKLESEGLFAVERKRALPELPHRIGVVTSREGAVIHDFINNLGHFGFEVSLVDSRVEGQQAVTPLLQAIRTLKKKDIEALVVIRGGGSFESLQAFNNEMLVRELVNFPVPVIAGIGHDKDVPLAALVADYMVSTPTAAAHLLNESWEGAYAKIHQVPHLLARIKREFERIQTDFKVAEDAMFAHIEGGIESLRQVLHNAEQVIALNDPVRQLRLGYAIVRKEGKIAKTIRDFSITERASIQVSDGILLARVEEKSEYKNHGNKGK